MCCDVEEIYSRNRLFNRLRRPSPKSYDRALFTLYTFFAAILTLCDAFREPTSLINAYFAGFQRNFIAVPSRCKVSPILVVCFTPRSCRRRSRFSSFAAGNAVCEKME